MCRSAALILLAMGVFHPTLVLTDKVGTYNELMYAVLGRRTVEITDFVGSPTSLEIPEEIEGKAVTSIGDSAFADCTSLTDITIPNSVTFIEGEIFNNCSDLANITILNSDCHIVFRADIVYNSHEDTDGEDIYIYTGAPSPATKTPLPRHTLKNTATLLYPWGSFPRIKEHRRGR